MENLLTNKLLLIKIKYKLIKLNKFKNKINLKLN